MSHEEFRGESGLQLIGPYWWVSLLLISLFLLASFGTLLRTPNLCLRESPSPAFTLSWVEGQQGLLLGGLLGSSEQGQVSVQSAHPSFPWLAPYPSSLFYVTSPLQTGLPGYSQVFS